jgi:nucleoside-diphosphate-sugar epimerase
VYDFCSLRRQACISESTPLDPRPLERDAYTTTKIIQEELVRSICDEASADYVIIRPGQIYGPGKVWGFGKAFSVGPFDVMLAPRAKLRLTYVDNCAAAILRALDAAVASGSTFNIVDDELPSHWEYYKLCRRAGASTGWLIPVPWSALSLVGIIVRHINKLLFRDRAQLPEILAWRRQQARWKPFSYTNASAKRALGWFPEVGLQEGVRATVSETPRT